MQEIFGIITLTQDDEMVEQVGRQIIDNLEMVEMVQMVDKWLFLMIPFMSKGALTFVAVAVVSLDMSVVRLVDELLEVMERQDQIDGLCSILWITLIFQTSILKTIVITKQFWFLGKIHSLNNLHQIHEKRQSFVFQQQTFRLQ